MIKQLIELAQDAKKNIVHKNPAVAIAALDTMTDLLCNPWRDPEKDPPRDHVRIMILYADYKELKVSSGHAYRKYYRRVRKFYVDHDMVRIADVYGWMELPPAKRGD